MVCLYVLYACVYSALRVIRTVRVNYEWVNIVYWCILPSWQCFLFLSFRGHSCAGPRTIKRVIHHYAPVLILRLYEHCLYKRITTDQVVNSRQIQIGNRHYALAGITLHRNLHYCAMLFYMGNIYWYDGLRGKLEDIPDDIDSWFPSHAVLCQQ